MFVSTDGMFSNCYALSPIWPWDHTWCVKCVVQHWNSNSSQIRIETPGFFFPYMCSLNVKSALPLLDMWTITYIWLYHTDYHMDHMWLFNTQISTVCTNRSCVTDEASSVYTNIACFHLLGHYEFELLVASAHSQIGKLKPSVIVLTLGFLC